MDYPIFLCAKLEAQALFEDNKMSLNIVKKYIESKSKSGFSWGILFLYLRTIHLSNAKKYLQTTDIQLATNIELFIISTDILDDLMDKDSDMLTYSRADYHSSKQILEKTLSSLKKNLNSVNNKADIWLVFKYNLKLSLRHQLLDLKNTIKKESTEAEYYSISVNKSVYLVNAITQLAWLEAKQEVSNFSKYFSIANQINNDISNLSSAIPSDVAQFKATLPIVMTVNRIQSNTVLKYFFERDTTYFTNVCKTITESGVIEYCRYVSNECYNKAYKSLDYLFPNSERQIQAFKNHLKG